MDLVWREGGWCLFIDELYYIQQELKLTQQVTQLLTQGRSNHISVVIGIQRPAWVTRFALSEPSHILCARLGDRRDAKTIKEIIGDSYLTAVEQVAWHKFVWLDKLSAQTEIVDKNNVAERLGGKRYGI
jgi:hypothetical protein